MKPTTTKTALLTAATLFAVPLSAHAEEPASGTMINAADQPAPQIDNDPGVWRYSTGINYSEGDYGDTQSTKVIAVPYAVKYQRGNFFVRVSTSAVRIEGPGSLLDTPQGQDGGFGDGGSGSGSDSGSGGDDSGGSSGGGSGGSGGDDSGGSGSGSGGSSGGGGSDDGGSDGGTVVPPAGSGGGTGLGSSRRGGIGDVSVTLGYSFDLGETTYLDTTARVKLPTASRRKGLGTGKVDVTLGADLVQDIGEASLYVGGRRKFAGKPAASALRDTWGMGGGASYRLEGGTVIGADYDWQQASYAGGGASSEVTGWVNFRLAPKVRMQLFASTGLNRNSTDFAGGMSLSFRLN